MKKLLLLTLASSVLFCDVSLAAQTRQSSYTSEQNSNTLIAQKQDASNASVDKVKSTPAKSPTASKFDAFMKAGYSAYDKKDYKTALTNFQSALALRPNNVYATKAIHNTEKKITGK
jgi:TolA-binding protein